MIYVMYQVFWIFFFLVTIQTYSFLNNVDFPERTLNEKLLKLTAWCQGNKLSINYSKFRQKRQTLDLKLEIGNCVIKPVKETLFLGVILNENLRWKQRSG